MKTSQLNKIKESIKKLYGFCKRISDPLNVDFPDVKSAMGDPSEMDEAIGYMGSHIIEQEKLLNHFKQRETALENLLQEHKNEIMRLERENDYLKKMLRRWKATAVLE